MSQALLVVEDEVLVRFDISDYLGAQGYVVLEASTAQQAITILEKGAPVSLTFTDVQMPGQLSGFDLADYVFRNHQGTKLIVTSGHIRGSPISAGLRTTGGEVIPSGPSLSPSSGGIMLIRSVMPNSAPGQRETKA